MKKIVPHLWFDTQAKEAAQFYTTAFSNSKINNVSTIHDVPSPSGDSDIVSFQLRGMPFVAISAGPIFKLNPSVSFIVNFDPKENIDEAWKKLANGGTVLMPIQEYPFSKRYGWIQDKYGVSWQLILTNPEGDERPEIVPSLLFVGANCGKAEEAIRFYLSVFKESKMGSIMPDKEGRVMFADFKLLGTWLAAMDSAHDHKFAFNEAISLMVSCDTQKEIDYYWDKLSAVPEAEQCGWLKDKYGLSWQIIPTAMGEMMSKGSREQMARVTQAFLPMKKFDLAKLKKAFEGKVGVNQ